MPLNLLENLNNNLRGAAEIGASHRIFLSDY